MSLLFVSQTPDDVLLISDTLESLDGIPARFSQKVHPLPNNNMTMVYLGASYLGRAWLELVTELADGDDIETLNVIAPGVLRHIYADMERQTGEKPPSATIYHFGYPTGSDRLVSYTYRSGSDFEPERFEGVRFTAKPVPPEWKFDVPATREAAVDLAIRVRDMNGQQQGVGWGVAIGGDLYATFVENKCVQSWLWHRFDDHDTMLQTMRLPRCNPAIGVRHRP
ncbi:hypothetical protein [Microbacterium sp. NPDC055357]